MIIKTFRAETSSAALKRVREEMGGDAIVLKTVQESTALGKIIYEVTACLENPTVGQTTKIFPDKVKSDEVLDTSAPKKQIPQTAEPIVPSDKINDDVWQKRYEKLEMKINTFLESNMQIQKSQYAPFDSLIDQLHTQDFSDEFITEFIDELKNTYNNDVDSNEFAKIKLIEKISRCITDDFSLQTGDKLAFVGPAGSGKSSVMGKFAASLVLREKKKVTLVTLDDVKMGAYDETAAYAEILGTDYADNRTALESTADKDAIILIDTVALPQIIENIIPINDKLNTIGTTYRIAVFSAIMRSKDVVASKELINAINPTHLVITKTDMTKCLGTLITAAHSFGLKILYTTDTQGGIGLLQTPRVSDLVNQILQLEVASE